MSELSGCSRASGDVPRVDREVNPSRTPVCVLQAVAATVEKDLRADPPARRRRFREAGCSGERRDEWVGRSGHELIRRPGLEELAVDDDADRVGERRGVFEVVRDDDCREVEVAEVLVELEADRGLRVGVQRRQRLVEEENVGVARERTGEADSLTFAAGEVVGCARGVGG